MYFYNENMSWINCSSLGLMSLSKLFQSGWGIASRIAGILLQWGFFFCILPAQIHVCCQHLYPHQYLSEMFMILMCCVCYRWQYLSYVPNLCLYFYCCACYLWKYPCCLWYLCPHFWDHENKGNTFVMYIICANIPVWSLSCSSYTTRIVWLPRSSSHHSCGGQTSRSSLCYACFLCQYFSVLCMLPD